MSNLTNSQEPEAQGVACFDLLEPETEPLEKNARSLCNLGKKSRAGAGKNYPDIYHSLLFYKKKI